MAENEGAREAVLSRLRARLERLGDLVGSRAPVGSHDGNETVANSRVPAQRSGLEAVLRAHERSPARIGPIGGNRRASA
jgi:hypothetical protein